MNSTATRWATRSALVLTPLALLIVVWIRPPLVADVRQAAGIGERTVIMPQGTTAEQTFQVTGDHIDGVGFVVHMPGAGDGVVTISVRPADGAGGAARERTAVISRRGITPTELVHARFPRLLTRPGDRFVLSVKTDAVMSLGSAGRDAYPRGELASATERDPNDLIFRVYRAANGHDLTRGLVGSQAWFAMVLAGAAAFVAGWALHLLLGIDRPLR